jgi:hypothetical protein
MAKTWRRLPAKARQQLSDERLIRKTVISKIVDPERQNWSWILDGGKVRGPPQSQQQQQQQQQRSSAVEVSVISTRAAAAARGTYKNKKWPPFWAAAWQQRADNNKNLFYSHAHGPMVPFFSLSSAAVVMHKNSLLSDSHKKLRRASASSRWQDW